MVNVKPVKLGNRERMSFGKINEVIDMPNLIDVQKQSYQWFLEEGLKEVFKEVSAITDYQNNLVLYLLITLLMLITQITALWNVSQEMLHSLPLCVLQQDF